MADPRREPRGTVTDALAAAPETFDFHQAVRLLERAAGRRVGTDTLPAAEPVYISVPPSLNFPRSAIVALTPVAGQSAPRLGITFAGLTGPNGILPQHYTALAMRRARAKDTTLRDFLDVFHHRLFSLQMRVWEKGHLPAAHEADPNGAAGTVAVRAVAGVESPALRGRTAFADDAFLEYAALFAARPPSAAGLERVLRGYFGWPVTVEEFVGQWLYLDAENRTALPSVTDPAGRNAQLGYDAVLGRRVWDVRNKVRIRLGPLDFPAFQSLQPGGDARAAVSDLARAYVGAEFDLEMNPVLMADAVPPLELNPDEIDGPRLGRTCWVASHGVPTPATDARFEVTA